MGFYALWTADKRVMASYVVRIFQIDDGLLPTNILVQEAGGLMPLHYNEESIRREFPSLNTEVIDSREAAKRLGRRLMIAAGYDYPISKSVFGKVSGKVGEGLSISLSLILVLTFMVLAGGMSVVYFIGLELRRLF